MGDPIFHPILDPILAQQKPRNRIDSSIILSKENKIANQRHQTRTSHREVEKGTASPFQAFNAGLNEETGDREYLRRCNVFQDGSARVDLI